MEYAQKEIERMRREKVSNNVYLRPQSASINIKKMIIGRDKTSSQT